MEKYKIKAWWNVFKILFFVDGLLRVTGYVMFVFAYPLRNLLYWMRTKKVWKYIAIPLWIYLPENKFEELYGNEEECWKNIGVYPTN